MKYTEEQKLERVELLRAKIRVAKLEGNKAELKRLYNMLGITNSRFGFGKKKSI